MHLKRSDFICIGVVLAVIAAFVLMAPLRDFYNDFNGDFPFIMGFIKFGLLATFGEMLALRIRQGTYTKPGFGILIRMIIWGFLGMTIVAAMMIFKTGVPVMLTAMGFDSAIPVFADSLSWGKACVAFAVSVTMNIIYAPVMMSFHKITDMHIADTGGTVKGFFANRLHFGEVTQRINWVNQWNFVFLKTIPLFWFPMHTITFILPANLQVLFAALLSIALGVILAIASMKGKENKPQQPQVAEQAKA
ncbi:MAG: hypothetical protein FWF37_03890 [Chloroflexi bacterium]|nr:hypothetical protein [Chloroflexota bacterium]